MRQLVWLMLTLTLVSAGILAHPDDLKSVLEDIVKRLDEKETRIKQLEEKLTAKEDYEARIRQLEIAAEENKAIAEERKAIAEEQKAIAEEHKAIEEENKAIAEERKAIAEEQKAIAEEQKAIAEEHKAIAEEHKAIEERKAIEEERKAIEEERKAIEEERKAIEEERKAIAMEHKTIAEERKAIAEEQKANAEELIKTVDQYKHTIESQQQRISTLEQEVTVQKIMTEELQAKETSNNDNPTRSENTTVHAMEGTTVRFNGKLTKRSKLQQRDSENPVAFLASLNSHAESLGQNQNIPFDNVITNIGDAYNNHAGLFIAPVSGIYVFSTTILSYRNTQSHFAVFKNGNMVTRMFYHGDSIHGYDTTSNTVTLQLAKGDDVSIANTDSDKDVYGNHYSTFTGFLLQEIYDGTTVVGK